MLIKQGINEWFPSYAGLSKESAVVGMMLNHRCIPMTSDGAFCISWLSSHSCPDTVPLIYFVKCVMTVIVGISFLMGYSALQFLVLFVNLSLKWEL